MEVLGEQGCRRSIRLRESIGRWSISFIVTLLSQFSLLLVPFFSPSRSLLSNLFFSGVLLLTLVVIAKAFKRLLNLRASAPALVFCNILYIWFVYLATLQQAILRSRGVLLNGGLVLLVFGFFRILGSDPGLVRHIDYNLDELVHHSNSESANHEKEFQPSCNNLSHDNIFEEGSFSMRRVRYCGICKLYVRGYDHHCPAFGNCIGEKNHILFMALLIGFIIMEGLYIMCSYEFARIYEMQRVNRSRIINDLNLAVSTMFFCFLQVLWQVAFLAWHIYCICFNIRTDEWINWKRCPEFQLIDHSSSAVVFTNPYDKGILSNLKEFLWNQH